MNKFILYRSFLLVIYTENKKYTAGCGIIIVIMLTGRERSFVFFKGKHFVPVETITDGIRFNFEIKWLLLCIL